MLTFHIFCTCSCLCLDNSLSGTVGFEDNINSGIEDDRTCLLVNWLPFTKHEMEFTFDKPVKPVRKSVKISITETE